MPIFQTRALSIAVLLGFSASALFSCTATANEAVVSQQNAIGEHLLPLDAASTNWLSVGERSGIQILDADLDTLDAWDRNAEYLDSRTITLNAVQKRLFSSVDTRSNQVLLYSVDLGSTDINQELVSSTLPYPIEGLCLHKDQHGVLHLFLISELFQAHQYLITPDANEQLQLRPLRTLPLGPETEFCATDDQTETVFFSEAEKTLWAFSTHPEAEVLRTLVDIAAPFGTLDSGPLGLSTSQGTLNVLSSNGPQLHRYTPENDAESFSHTSSLPLNNYAIESSESLSSIVNDGKVTHSLFDEEHSRVTLIEQNVSAMSMPSGALAEVKPLAETEPMPQFGDAADDPALWVHPTEAHLSLVVGTNKRQGLFIYDLEGKLVQQLDVGRLNNVDIRYGLNIAGNTVDIAVASNRDLNALSVFSINRQSRAFELVATIATPLQDIYGLCMYQDGAGKMFTFANDADGRFLQYALTANGNTVSGELTRQFQVASQPEGCVADDQLGQLFIGEEDVGIWTLGANAQDSTSLNSVAMIGDELHDDVEGLALYKTAGRSILIASSQGNDSYALFATTPPYRALGAFRIGLNIALGIDGASETDGLEASSANLGGPYSDGILIVQDGRNVLPTQEQNFKLVPWRDIQALFPDL